MLLIERSIVIVRLLRCGSDRS